MFIPATAVAELRRRFGSQVREEVPLAPRTTIGVGGSARLYLAPESLDELERMHEALVALGLPAFFLGGGGNVIVADRGVRRQAVISLVEHPHGMEMVSAAGNKLAVRVEAGARLAALAAFCRQRGAGGLEFLAGIPGSVGGAVAMNAGAFGSEIGDFIETVEFYSPAAGRRTVPRRELAMGYRRGGVPAGFQVVGVRLVLERREPEVITARMDTWRETRRRRQPCGVATCGSVFRNPPGDYAGRLIEAAGCKGWRQGGARVADEHANFIIAERGARAAEVLALIDRVRERVAARFGIELEEEIVRLGD